MANILGTSGNDTLNGGDENDSIGGDDGNDVLGGGNGDDSISGGSGDDSLLGGLGNDTLDGGPGGDTVRGEAGDDRLIAGGGSTIRLNVLDYSNSPSAVTAILTGGNDTIADGFGSTDTATGFEGIFGSPFNDSLTGVDGPQAIFGGFFLSGAAGNDTLNGGAGVDTLVAGLGSDSLSGGPDVDFARYIGYPSALVINLSTGTATDGLGKVDTLTGIENVDGTSFADVIVGDAGNNFLFGGGGADTLDGGDGNDNITGAALAIGGPGDDEILAGSGGTARGGPGTDTLNAATFDYTDSPGPVNVDVFTSTGNFGQRLGTAQDGFGFVDVLKSSLLGSGINGSAFGDSLTGASGADTINGGDGADSIDGEAAGDVLKGGGGNDVIVGGDGFDSLEGGDGADTLQGGEDSDNLQGGNGDDAIIGGNGNDNIQAGAGNDTIECELGNDTVDAGDGDDSVNGGLGRNSLDGGAGDDTLIGGNDTLQNSFVGGSGNDLMVGGPGIDRLSYSTSPGPMSVDLAAGAAQDGFGFNDTLSSMESIVGSAFNDTQTGGAEDDVLLGNDGDDLLRGGNGNDLIGGGSDNDSLEGGAGADSLFGNAGMDFLTGGSGNDVFNFNLPDPGIDRIVDLAPGDVIRITGANFANAAPPPGDPQSAVAPEAVGPSPGNGGTVGANAVQLSAAGGITTLFVGLDTVPGADVTIELTGNFAPGDFRLSGTDITLLPAVSIANASIAEGNAGTTDLTFTISLSDVSGQPVTVTATTANGTASAGSDYAAKSQVVTIPGGQTSATFTVAVAGDTVFEPDETFTVTLSNPVGAPLGAQSSATGTIVNDDAQPVASIANASLIEGDGGAANLVFTISLSAVPTQDVSVTATTQDEIARAGSDYAASSAVVTIPAGQTSASFSVPIFGDTAIEIDESFAVVLSSPTGGALISATAGAARGFILNDDLTSTIVVNGQTLNGTGGDDFLVASALNDSVRGEGGADTEFGNEQSDILLGGAGNDFILGDFPGNFLDGSADFIDAGEGNDNVFGGGGDDTVFGGNGDDLIGGDFGDNLIFGGDGNNALIGFGGADTIQGGNDGDIVFGLSGPDVISTKGGFDLIIAGGDLDGPTDADFIDVADGGSQVFAGSGDDTILAGEGPDFMLGESGADIMRAGGGADIVIAGPGNDTLDGGAGNDVIIPEGGDDLIAGGAGADLFRYPGGIAVDNDRISDFAPSDDTVELGAALGFATAVQALAAVTQSGADAVLTLTGGAITFVGVQASALTAGDFVIV